MLQPLSRMQLYHEAVASKHNDFDEATQELGQFLSGVVAALPDEVYYLDEGFEQGQEAIQESWEAFCESDSANGMTSNIEVFGLIETARGRIRDIPGLLPARIVDYCYLGVAHDDIDGGAFTIWFFWAP